MVSFKPLGPAARTLALTDLRQRLAKMPFQRRDAQLISTEYGDGKYGPIWQESPRSIEDATALLLEFSNTDPKAERLISLDDQLFLASFEDAEQFHNDTLDEVVRSTLADCCANYDLAPSELTICELGCGFGPHLARWSRQGLAKVCGGEFTPQGRQLAKHFGLDVKPFDFYDPASYDMIPNNSVVVTCAALEQVPRAAMFFEYLKRVLDRVRAVVHFEPTQRHVSSPLVQLQNAYGQLCDYNHDLIDCLQRPGCAVTQTSLGFLGINPLNPHHIFVWH